MNIMKKIIVSASLLASPCYLYAGQVNIPGSNASNCKFESFSVTTETASSPSILTLNLENVDCLSGGESKGHKPIIKLNGSATITIKVGEEYVELKATAEDEEDGDLTSQILITGVVDNNTLGKYIIKYSVTDSEGNTATKSRTVNVVSKTPGSKKLSELTIDDLDPDREAKYANYNSGEEFISITPRDVINASGKHKNLYIVNLGDPGATALPSAMNGNSYKSLRGEDWIGAEASDLYAVRIKVPDTLSSNSIQISGLEFGGAFAQGVSGLYVLSEKPGDLVHPVAGNALDSCSYFGRSGSLNLISKDKFDSLDKRRQDLLRPKYCIVKRGSLLYINAEMRVVEVNEETGKTKCVVRSENCNLYFEAAMFYAK